MLKKWITNMGRFTISTLNLPIFPDCLVKFYANFPRSIKEDRKEEYDGNTLNFRFKGYDFYFTYENLIKIINLNSVDNPLNTLSFKHDEI